MDCTRRWRRSKIQSVLPFVCPPFFSPHSPPSCYLAPQTRHSDGRLRPAYTIMASFGTENTRARTATFCGRVGRLGERVVQPVLVIPLAASREHNTFNIPLPQPHVCLTPLPLVSTPTSDPSIVCCATKARRESHNAPTCK